MRKFKINRSDVMKLAWAIRRKNPEHRLADCQISAWKVVLLYQALRQGSVRFSFQKQNGEIRQAIGTLKPDMFIQPPKTTEQSAQLTLVRYFDMEKNAIRSFRADQIKQVAA